MNLGHPVHDLPLSTPRHHLTFVSFICFTGPSCFYKSLYTYHMLIPLLEVGRWAAMESCSICSQVLCLQRFLTKAALQLAPETKGNCEFTLEMPQLHWHHNKSETDESSRFTIRHYTHKTICRKCLYYNTTITGYIITPLTAYDPQPFLLICKGYYLWIRPKTSCGYQTELVPHHQCLSRVQQTGTLQ